MQRFIFCLTIACLPLFASACSKSETPPAKTSTSKPAKPIEKSATPKGNKKKNSTISQACRDEFNATCPAKMEKRWVCMKSNLKTFSPACMKEWMAQKGDSRKAPAKANK